MNDFIKRNKHDLRETRFSQNYETSIEMINQDETNYNNQIKRNTCISVSPFKIKNLFSSIHHDQSFIYVRGMTQSNKGAYEKTQQDEGTIKFAKSFSCFDNNIMTKDSLGNLENQVKYQSAMDYLSSTLKQDTSSDQSNESEQEDAFSQKISLIRGLGQKLFSLQQKIKVSSIPPVSPYFKVPKTNIKKDCQNLLLTNSQEKIKQNYNNFEADPRLIHEKYQNIKKEFEIKHADKSLASQSLDSESMLLEKDQQKSEKQINSLKFGSSKILEPEVQIVQVIKFVEIPYLIEIRRENDQQIESKKSFYFEENQEIHKTFEEFTQKQFVNESMLNMETRIKPSTMQQNQNDFQLEYSGTNILKNPSNCIEQDQNSLMNDTNKTFHNELKQKLNDVSYNFEENSQILSKLLTKHNPSQLEQFEEKLKQLEIQSEEMKERLNEKQNDNNCLQEENKVLTQELQNLIEFEFIYLQRLKKYEQKLQISKEQFAQIHQTQLQKLRQHYEKIIEIYENQQSQYANRIISFEQLFEQHQNKQSKINQFIEQQSQQIEYLKKLCLEKDTEIEGEDIKRRQTQDLIVKRQNQLKKDIQKLQKNNSDLRILIKQIHTRYESQGFYILKDQAQQIKKTIEQKDQTHFEELQKLENRYTSIIAKYQKQLQMMKKGLQKVRIDKSVSISKSLKSQNQSIENQIKDNVNGSTFRRRNSIFKTQVSSLSMSPKQKLQKTEVKQMTGLNKLKMRNVESTEDSTIQMKNQLNGQNTQNLEELLVCEINYLKEENSNLKADLYQQRSNKYNLSQKLSQITDIMSKQISQLSESQSQLQKNQQVLEQCVKQLQKQYQMNKKLKQELQKTKQLLKGQQKTEKSSQQSIDQEQIKLHPMFLELNKKYIKSKKYIKVLQKQLLEITLLPDFNEQKDQCCQNKDKIIKELKQIAFGKLNQNQVLV